MAKKIQSHIFVDGVNSDLSDEHITSRQARFMLNCNILSTAEGNIGVVTNVKGNIAIPVELPEGDNKTIGVCLDEESDCFYYAVWNSNNYHTWFKFDAISETVSVVIQCIRDTGGVDIFQWKEKDLILHTVIKNNNLLYWSMAGHPARKINIDRAVDKNDTGYGTVILEDYTRAYKKTADFPPEAKYITDTNVLYNYVYGNLFKFAVRFIYDDGEKSVYSDYSLVPIPDQENTSGTQGVPLTNNCISVNFLTGGMLVKKIELIMQKTDQETGGALDWVSIVVLDKDTLGIEDNTEYEYLFYNDNTYIPISQEEVVMPHLYFPRNPECMEEIGDRIGYANFEEGFPAVDIDIDYEVEYEDLFVPDDVIDRLNDPFLEVNVIENWHEPDTWLTKGWRHTTGEVVVGPDVKRGNLFSVWIFNGNDVESQFNHIATLTDTAETVANALANKFRSHDRMSGELNGNRGWVDRVTVSGGFARFRFDIWNRAGRPYHTFHTVRVPVNYSTLKNTGNSVLTNKLGSSHRYGIVYRDEDQMKSLTYGDVDAIYIKPLNELGGLKKAIIKLIIRHRAPSWAKTYEIVRTRNLVQESYIQILIQSAVTVSNILGETYTDLVIGSFNTYKAVHPNVALNHEFKKGDRVRLQKTYSGGDWSIPTDVIDYEVMEYYPETRRNVKKNITIDPSKNNLVLVNDPNPNDVGSFLWVDGHEREITGVSTTVDVGYELSSPIAPNTESNTARTYPSFDIINNRGVIRIKQNDDYPINAGGNTFALVEVYTPAQRYANSENENYYSIGYSYPITMEDGVYLHGGNAQDQTTSQPAIVQIEGYDNYVRNRELPISNDTESPQVIFSSIEDASFSDFYVSNLSSYGKTSRLDDSVGVVKFDSRIRYSLNYIEDTRINGLGFFLNLNRVDYNDKYGGIKRLISDEGRLYIFKHLKYLWAPVYGNVITDNENTDVISSSSNLLPDKPEYFLFNAGIGDNPESVVRYGNDIFSVSPNSGYIINIGGNGAIPVSKVFGMDKDVRDIIANASKSGARMFGAYDRKNGYYVVNIEGYDVIVFNSKITQNNHRVVEIPDVGNFQIVSGPNNGTVQMTDDGYIYYPNSNFSGEDVIQYRSGQGEIRSDVFNVLSFDTQLVWVGSEPSCLFDGSGDRTGEVSFSTLAEYDVLNEEYTGVTKPNIDTDPDYIAPYEDLDICPIGMQYSRLLIIRSSYNTQTLDIVVESEDQFNIILKKGDSFSGDTIWESGLSDSGSFNVPINQQPGDISLYIEVPSLNYEGVTSFSCSNGYLVSGNFNDLSGLIELVLDQSSIPSSHQNFFTSLLVNMCAELETLFVINHSIFGFSFANNTNLTDVDISGGRSLSSVTFFHELKTLKIHDSKMTSTSESPSAIDLVISRFNSYVTDGSGSVLQYGLNNSSGIKPSSSAIPDYISLLDKDVAIIGVPPTPESISVIIESYDTFNESLYTEISLTDSVYVPITISYTVKSIVNGVTYNFPVNEIFNPGDPLVRYILLQEGLTGGYIQNVSPSVSPNPAAGTEIQILNFNS